MAVFEGTVEEFMQFMGSFCRNKVLLITLSYKRKVGKCEECQSTTNLETAHIHGKERHVLIKNILRNYVNGNMFKVDLQEFEELFVKAHKPLERAIKILCNECHRKYDSLKLPTKPILKEQEVYSENDKNNNTYMISFSASRSIMSKSRALQLLNSRCNASLNHENTIFSNINKAIDVWWLEPKNIKFNAELHFVLNHPIVKKLYHFKIPAHTIKVPQSFFYQRNDKPASKIDIPISTTKFVDNKGYNFTPFLTNEISY